MSFATLRRDVAECRAWEKRLHAGSKETRKAAKMPGWPEWVLPLMIVAYGLFTWKTGSAKSPGSWILALSVYLLAVRGRLVPPLLPTEWESLGLPSRRAWLLARWSHRLPALLWLGACLLGAFLFISLRQVPDPQGIRWPVAFVYLLSPVLLVVSIPWYSVRTRLFSGAPIVASLLAIILACFFASVSVFAFFASETKGSKALFATGLFLTLAFLTLLPVLHYLRPYTPGNPGRRGWRVWASALGTLLLGTGGTLSLIALFFSLFNVEQGLLVQAGGAEMARLQLWMVAPAVVTSLLMAGDTLRLLPRVDLTAPIRVPPRKRTLRRSSSADPLLPEVHTGAGLRSAAWCLYRGKWRFLRFPWIEGPLWALWECRALPYGFFAVCFLAWGHASWGRTGNFVGGTLLLLSAWLLPSPLELPESRRLHLLGAEFEDVVRHNRKWGFLLAVVPVFVGGGLVLLIPDYILRFEPLLLLGAILACTGVTLLFKCDDANWLWRVAYRAGWRGTLPVTGTALILWLASPRIGLMVLGPVIFLVGFVSVVGDYLDPAGSVRKMAEDAVDD